MLYNLINGAILRFHHTSLNDFFVRKLDLDPKWVRLSFMAPGPARIYWGDPRTKPSFLSSTSFWYQNIDFGQPFLRCYCFFLLILMFEIVHVVLSKRFDLLLCLSIILFGMIVLFCCFESALSLPLDYQNWLLVVMWCTLHYLWLPCCCSLWLTAVLSCCSINCCWYR